MCVCTSEMLPSDGGSLAFDINGAVAFLQNDQIGQKYALDGQIECSMSDGSGSGRVQGASQPLCHYVSSAEGDFDYDIGLKIDVAKSLSSNQQRSHVALFNITSSSSSDGEGGRRSYSGHIGSKLSALDSICDDIVCRSMQKGVRTFVVNNGKPEEEEKRVEEKRVEEKRVEEEEEAESPSAPVEELAKPVEPVDLSFEAPKEEEEPAAPERSSGLYTAGMDGSVAKNPAGKLRCSGKSSTSMKPDCGDQGFCMDEMTGAACYWDCQPGWCSCTAGTCFDKEGKCTIPATYPASNNYQATCASNGQGSLNKIKEVEQAPAPVSSPDNYDQSASDAVTYTGGHDGAKPPNQLKSLRCGGHKGKPHCGDMGFCMDERTGDRCFWDCDPGWCSCNSGACFDSYGRCTESATYPESSDWQATCDIENMEQSGQSGNYKAGRDGARPPNHAGKMRCGGTKGKPDCGIQGFCMGESTGEACYWDCEPGFCSCTSGSCFDTDGRCNLKASYPVSNNYQATCPFY